MFCHYFETAPNTDSNDPVLISFQLFPHGFLIFSFLSFKERIELKTLSLFIIKLPIS